MRSTMSRIKRLLGNENGFGFAELMISSTILFLSVLAFTSLMSSSLQFMGSTHTKTLGYNLATKAIEDLKDMDYSSVDSSGPDTITQDGFTFTRNITVIEIDNSSPADGIMDVKKITIDLSWDKPFSGTYSAVTYLNPYGAVESAPSSPADIVSPDLQVTNPSGIGTISGVVDLSITANDIYGVEKIDIYIDDVLTQTDTQHPISPGSSVSSYSWNTTQISDGIHTVYAKAYDEAGNIGTSQSIGFLIVNSPSNDSVSPTAPGAFNSKRSYTLMGQPTNKIDLAWTASSDNIGVSWYRIERWSVGGDWLLKTRLTTSLSSVDIVFSETTTYWYRAIAIDGSGNESPPSNWAEPDDIQSPSTPTNLYTIEKTGNYIYFQWDAVIDDGTITKYHIHDNGTHLQNVTPTTPTVSATISYGGGNKEWSLTIIAEDDLGFQSNDSIPITWSSY